MPPATRVWLPALVVCFATIAACVSLAGLDGDYILGNPNSGGSATQAGPMTSASSGGSSPGVGGAPAGGSPATGGSGGVTPDLDDTDLFARYWIDEGAMGPATGSLIDAAPNPEPLTLVPQTGTTMDWIEPEPGHRGIEWGANSLGGQASAPVMGTKFTQLWGRTNLTVEVVFSQRGDPSWHARLFHLGDDSTASTLQLSRVAGDLYLYVNDLGYHVWTVPPQNQRVVVHFVLDTTLSANERARLFENGSLLPPSVDYPPPANETLAEEPDPLPDYFVIGNTSGGTRSWIGDIHYLAVYTTTFTTQRVADHAAVLAVTDDAP